MFSKTSRILMLAGTMVQQTQSKEEQYKTDESDNLASWARLRDFVELKMTGFANWFRKTGSEEIMSSTHAEMANEVRTKMTGWDRLKYIFSVSEHQNLSPELQFIFNSFSLGFIIGFCYGGMRDYKQAYDLFMESNDATKFMTVNDAKVQLSRTGLKAFLKGGLLTGPKTAVLLSTFVLTSTVVSTYRGKNGIMEFPIAGAVTTLLMKWNLGIRGMISGFVSGGLTGLIMGPIYYCGFKIFGKDMSDIKQYMYMVQERRKERERKSSEKNDFDYMLGKIHEDIIKHLPPDETRE